MKKQKTISIIVPIYNVEEYLSKCFDSLLEQTYKNIEVLAVIDGSQDNSADIVKEYSKRDSRIKCIEKENGGYGSVLEYAIRQIKNEYFLICDPDDWLEKNAIEILYENAIKYDLDIICGDKYYVYSSDYSKEYASSVNVNYPVKANEVMTNEEAKKIVLLNTTPHAKLYRTALAKNIKFPRKVSYTDFLLFVACASNARRTMYIDRALAYYLVDRIGNTVTDVSLKSLNAKITVFNETYSYLINNNNLNKYIFTKMYFQIRGVVIPFASGLNKEDIKSIKDDLYNLIIKLKPKKSIIWNYLRECKGRKNFLNNIIFWLLFSKLFMRISLNCLISIYRKGSK